MNLGVGELAIRRKQEKPLTSKLFKEKNLTWDFKGLKAWKTNNT